MSAGACLVSLADLLDPADIEQARCHVRWLVEVEETVGLLDDDDQDDELVRLLRDAPVEDGAASSPLPACEAQRAFRLAARPGAPVGESGFRFCRRHPS